MTPQLVKSLRELDPDELGSRIRAARLSAGLTQAELAGEDISVTYVSRIESGQRRPRPDLIDVLAARLAVTSEYLVLGAAWESTQWVWLQLDYAEVSLATGDPERALELARAARASPGLASIPTGFDRARYFEAAALDALGDPAAAQCFEALLADGPELEMKLKALTAVSRLLRQSGDLERAIALARTAVELLPAQLHGGDDRIRLAAVLATAVFETGRGDEALAICEEAIAAAEHVSCPVVAATAYHDSSVLHAEAGQMIDALSLSGKALHHLRSAERWRDLGNLRTQFSQVLLNAEPPRLAAADAQLKIADVELDWSCAGPEDMASKDLVKAHLLQIQGRPDEARYLAEAALAMAQDALPAVAVSANLFLGQLAWSRQDQDEARRRFAAAVERLSEVGAAPGAGQLWFELGTAAESAGLVDEAREAYRRAAASSGLTAKAPGALQVQG